MKPKSLSQILTLCLLGGVATLFGCAPPPTNGIITNHSIQDPTEETPLENSEEETPDQKEERIEEAIDKKVAEKLPEGDMTQKELKELVEKYREQERARQKLEDEKKREQSQTTQKKPAPSEGSVWPKPSKRPSPNVSPSPNASPSTKTSPTPSVSSSPKTPAKPSTNPTPKPPVKPIPQKPIPSIGPKNPPTPPTTEDTGVDAEDEILSKTYLGPKEVVYRPRSTSDFNLSETAAHLGTLGKKSYLKKQKDVVDLATAACNLFVITALWEAKVINEHYIPTYLAGEFPKRYFVPMGWKKIDFKTAMAWMREERSFDIVIQKDPPAGKDHGHIAIPVGLNAKGDPLVAEGVLNGATNRIRVYSPQEISKYNVYVRHENLLAAKTNP